MSILKAPIVAVDYFFYGKFEFVPLNIVLYNVFGGPDRGPNIFGTEPWWFYVVNGFLNFNLVFLLALGSAFCVVSIIHLTFCAQKQLPLFTHVYRLSRWLQCT